MHGTKFTGVAALLVGVAAFALPATTAFAQYYRPGAGGAAAAPSRGGAPAPAASSGGLYRPGSGGGAATGPTTYYRPGTGNVGAGSHANAGYRGGWRHHRGGRGWGWGSGFAIGSGLGYGFGSYGYPYDDYGDGAYAYDNDAYAPAPYASAGNPDDSYCAQRFRSYDPASGTYLGYDGQRHPCP